MKAATRRLLEEQLVVVAVIGRGKKSDALWHVPHCEDNYIFEVFKYLNESTTASARVLFDCDLNYRTRNNGAKLIVKHFNTSVTQHFYPIKITS